MKRVPKPHNSDASALSRALRSEKRKFDGITTQSHDTKTSDPDSPAASSAFTNNSNIAPHFAQTLEERSNAKGIKHEYAAILNLNGKWVITQPTFNPVAQKTPQQAANVVSTFDVRRLPGEIRSRVHELEKRGFQFLGTNQDILVFERLYNQKQQDRFWASRSAITLTTSVIILTGALFTLEYLS